MKSHSTELKSKAVEISSERIDEKGDGPYRGFGYLSYRFGNMEPKRITVILQLSKRIVETKIIIIQNGVKYIIHWLEKESKLIIMF